MGNRKNTENCKWLLHEFPRKVKDEIITESIKRGYQNVRVFLVDVWKEYKKIKK